MRHDICYRDNETSAGKHECDRKMLVGLNALVPNGRREKVDKQLVRSISGLKHRMGLSIHWTSQLANELLKPVRRRFDKRTVFVKQVDGIWTADLVDMSLFSRSNKGYKYLLTVIDVFRKYGWIVPLKTKTGKEVAQAFRKLFLNGHPSHLWTDKGTEFYNQQLKAVLTANNVMLYSTGNEEKSSVVERWNRTIKNIIWKYFTANIDVLPSIVETYKNTYHRSIKLTLQMHITSYQHVHNQCSKSYIIKIPCCYKVHITRKARLRKDLHPIGQKRCLPLVVKKLLNRQRILPRIHLEKQLKGPFTSKSYTIECTGNLPYRASIQGEEKSSICQVERLQ